MLKFKLNGKETTFSGDPDTPLLWIVRDFENLTGTKYGCGVAQCGACTVLLDGKTKRSCVTRVADVANREVTTIEGIGDEGKVAKVVQDAWVDIDVPQCGYCQSGQIVSATALLKVKPNPTDEDIDRAMAGNICRCATYQRVRQAIHNAAKNLSEEA